MILEVRRGADRARTTAPGLESRHSFSFGPHYDPANLGFGDLLVSNEDRLVPGAGFDVHAHRDVDIVTWVLSGALEHRDSTGHRETLTAGMAQVLRTGAGVRHAEHAAPAGRTDADATHYVQMWLRSGATEADPVYECTDFSAALTAASRAQPPRLASIAAGPPAAAALALSRRGAEFAVGILAPGAAVQLHTAPRRHLFVAAGRIAIVDACEASTRLGAGDAARMTPATAVVIRADEAAQVLVWTLPA